MKFHQCKCGKRQYFESGMLPQPCQGCDECNTTLTTRPDRHKTPEPHDFVIRYDSNTGKPKRLMCQRCFESAPLPEKLEKPE